MSVRSIGLWAALAVFASLLLSSCNGGDAGIQPGPGPAFSLFISADPDVGLSPMTVTFQAVPSGGFAPYTYTWDFNGDGVTDSNASNGTYTFTATSVASVTVTDGQQQIVTANKTVTITGVDPSGTSNALDVRYNATPISGNVPFNVQFEAFVDGGKPPYSYSWDFEGDGIFDSFISNPLHTFEEIGAQSGNEYVFFPMLRVEDNRGVIGTNFDDKDSNGNPDFKLEINALPPAGGMNVASNANPLTGQAPLTVEFTGSVIGGSGEYEFTWQFGDGITSTPTASSVSTHTYVQPGTYAAVCKVYDTLTTEEITTSPLTIVASVQQELGLTITSDVTEGQVPFVVNFEALPVNGTEPITFEWDIFTDVSPAAPGPSVGNPPTLVAAAVVTPDYSTRKNPTAHFGNTAGTGAPYSYVARCVAKDGAGNTKVSNLIRIIASPNTTYPYYECSRPMVVGSLVFPAFTGGESANPVYQAYPTPVPWAPRANPAVASHPTGVTYIFGGEILDENGNFERLVNVGDSAYVYVPSRAGTGTNETVVGKHTPQASGEIVKLNDVLGPAFPVTPTTAPGSPEWPDPGGDTKLPPIGDIELPAPNPGPSSTQRSAPFQIVGSAAAVMIHERPETNPAGAYPGPGVYHSAIFPNLYDSVDRDGYEPPAPPYIPGFPPDRLWAFGDSPEYGWGLET
jgi:PKD repeat protein